MSLSLLVGTTRQYHLKAGIIQCLFSRNDVARVILRFVLNKHGNLPCYAILNKQTLIRPRGYTTYFMLSSTEQEIYPAHKC